MLNDGQTWTKDLGNGADGDDGGLMDATLNTLDAKLREFAGLSSIFFVH
jgi:hypothetical protein